jgi:hypothetical protein
MLKKRGLEGTGRDSCPVETEEGVEGGEGGCCRRGEILRLELNCPVARLPP